MADPALQLQQLLQSVSNSPTPNHGLAALVATYAQQQALNTSTSSILVKLAASNPGISYELDSEDIQVLFRHYGAIRSCYIREDGAGVITFNEPNSCVTAIQELNNLDFPGIGHLLVTENKNQDLNLQPASSSPNPDLAALLFAALKGNNTSLHQPASHDSASRHDQLAPREVSQTMSQNKQMCRLELIDIFGEEQSGFDVISQLVGANNGNITHIINESRRVVDIHIKGKPVNQLPAVDRLHMVLVSPDAQGFSTALSLCEDLINAVVDEFQDHCRLHKRALPAEYGFRRHEYILKPDGSTQLTNSVPFLRTRETVSQRYDRSFDRMRYDRQGGHGSGYMPHVGHRSDRGARGRWDGR